jgi:hypothetical protein
MVFKDIFINISIILWGSILYVWEPGVKAVLAAL